MPQRKERAQVASRDVIQPEPQERALRDIARPGVCFLDRIEESHTVYFNTSSVTSGLQSIILL